MTPWRLFEPAEMHNEWVVLWLQGFTSTIEDHTEGVARMAEATATTFAMLNYAGHGDNPIPLDEATRSQQFDEVCAVYDELVRLGHKKVIVIGGSFGAYMAALLLAKRRVETVVLRAPAIYDDTEFGIPYVQTRSAWKGVKDDKTYRVDPWRSTVTSETESAALKSLAGFDGLTYVMEHELDEAVSRNIPKAYAEVASKASYILIEGCEHSPKLMPNPEHFYTIIERWLETIILNAKQV